MTASAAAGYAELHAKSFYSFGAGASHCHELLAQAEEHGYRALALTDTNLCGALEFARLADSLGVQPITGGELALADGSRLTLLARTRRGYANLSRLFTLANSADRTKPRIDPARLPEHAQGLILLTGGRGGRLAKLALEGRDREALDLLSRYRDWHGPGSVYVELQQNFLRGDAGRNRELIRLARRADVAVAATNDVHYHRPRRHRLQHALVAARRNTTLDQALPFIIPNHHLALKSPAQMRRLFQRCPEAIDNTERIAEQCRFNLAVDLGYTLPEPAVPEGHTPESYLEQLCRQAAARRYGSQQPGGSIPPPADERLREEFRLIRLHGLAGFLLLYREIVLIAHEIMKERGTADPEARVDERPPGRGRGSSVALLVGYLIGISHVDPLKWDLPLERFIRDDMSVLPDIDLDFPRNLRDELIERVHRHFGPEHAVLTGAISTYRLKGVIADLGKALGLPGEDLRLLSRQLHSHDAAELEDEMRQLPAFRDRVAAPGWRDLIELAPQLTGAPKRLGQHVGGMVLSDSPLPEMVPVRAGAIEGRFIMDWDKDSVADAGFAKIDLLSLPVLDQLDEALDLIEQRRGKRPDLSRIDPEDPLVYDMINSGRSKGVFLLQSPAQLKMGQRLRSRNLLDLAYQVALIRPGVGVQGSAVSQFVERYRHGASFEYDHRLEERALQRGCGVIVWQEQVLQLVMDVAGMTATQADEIRRAFSRPNNEHLLAMHRRRFCRGARHNGVPAEVARKIFGKINGHYMFPESHSHAFAITAYQAAWLKCHHRLEFFVALMNNQPMGFYPVETLKQDARRFGVLFLNPCVNRSQPQCAPESGSVRLGLRLVDNVGEALAGEIVEERRNGGPFAGAGELVRRTGIKPQAVVSLVRAGAFDAVAPNRRAALWAAGLSAPVAGRSGNASGSGGNASGSGGSASNRGGSGQRASRNGQRALPVPAGDRVPELPDFTEKEKMAGEYEVIGVYPKGHLMEAVRPRLRPGVLPTAAVEDAEEDEEVSVAGWPVARQHPRGRGGTVFVTIEDEHGDLQLILWPQVFHRFRRVLSRCVILVRGLVSRWDGTTSVIVEDVEGLETQIPMPPAHDWH